jgi:hypothetical protein
MRVGYTDMQELGYRSLPQKRPASRVGTGEKGSISTGEYRSQ